MIETLMQRWQLLAVRERRMVVAGGALLALVAVWLWLLEPAWQGRRALQAELPTLRAQLARIDEMADEAQRLAAVRGGGESPQALKAQIEQSIDRAGLSGSLRRLSMNGSLFDLRFEAVAYAAWLAWLDTTTRELRLRVADVSITRGTGHGLVAVRLALETSRAEGG